MKKLVCALLLSISGYGIAYETWITNSTGYDVRVKIFGTGRTASGVGEYWKTIKASETSRQTLDHGGHCVDGFSVDIIPPQGCLPQAAQTNPTVQVNVGGSSANCPVPGYSPQSLGALGFYVNNPANNKCGGLTITLSLVEERGTQNTLVDAYVKANVSTNEGNSENFVSKKLSELFPLPAAH